MQTVIGLGKAGCQIADSFNSYPQYNILKIDEGLEESSGSLGLKHQPSPEFYEANVPDLKTFFKEVKSEVLFITSCGTVSGSALQILKQIPNKSKVTIMYVVPNLVGLSETKRLQNNLLFNVFQEYARSAVFKDIILVDNKKISDMMGDIPILQYWPKLNEIIVSMYHMLNVLKHSKPLFTTFGERVDTAKITTIGLVDWQEEKENLLFKLDIPREKRYYYAIPQVMLEEDTTLMTRIEKQVKKSVEHDKMRISYGIYSTQYTEPYVYCESNSSMIQKLSAL